MSTDNTTTGEVPVSSPLKTLISIATTIVVTVAVFYLLCSPELAISLARGGH